MKHTRIIFMVLVFWAIATDAFSSVINREDAEIVASEFFMRKSGESDLQQPKLCYEAMQTGKPAFYVFSFNPTGFVIVSAEDDMRPVLGYSLTSTFSVEDATDGMQWWMGEYKKQAQLASDGGAQKRVFDNSLRSSSQSIKPLITTQWGQAGGFSTYMPSVDGKKCLAGCVAVSMAQVMSYYKYPQKGMGSHSYTASLNECKEYFSVNFYDYKFNWDEILQNNAEASTLMYLCGVSVDMNYGLSVSSTYNVNVARAMSMYFDYDKGIKSLNRTFYTDDEWEEMIKAELLAGRPVIYGGYDGEKGGHCFICDGYDSETGLYHINWGWNGMHDGYYAITGAYALKNSSGTFNLNHNMIANIKPNRGGKALSEVVADGGNLSILRSTLYSTDSYSIAFVYDDSSLGDNGKANIYNSNYNDGEVLFTVKYENTCTGEVSYAEPWSFVNAYKMTGMYNGIIYRTSSVELPRMSNLDLNKGIYVATLVYADYHQYRGAQQTEWREVRCPQVDYSNKMCVTNGIYMTAKNLNINLSEYETVDAYSRLLPSGLDCYGLTWKSGDTEVAKVDENGMVTAVGEGKTEVTAILMNNDKVVFSIVVDGYTAVDELSKTDNSLIHAYDNKVQFLLDGAEYVVLDALGRTVYEGVGEGVFEFPSSGVYVINSTLNGVSSRTKVLSR